MGMGFAPTWLRQVSPPLHKTTLTTGSICCQSLNMLLAFGLLTSLLISVKLKVFSANLLSLPGCSHLSYPDRLNLDSLVARRLWHDLILTYKIVFGLTDMNREDFFTFANSNHNTRGHAYKLLPSHCRVNMRKGFLQKG